MQIRLYKKMCSTMATTSLNMLSEKQIGFALRIVYRYYVAGFHFNSFLSNQIENDKIFIERVTKNLKSMSKEKYFCK